MRPARSTAVGDLLSSNLEVVEEDYANCMSPKAF